MTGLGKAISIIIIILLNLHCNSSADDETPVPSSWDVFKKGIYCGMAFDSLINYCEKQNWVEVGKLGYGKSKSHSSENKFGDTKREFYRLRYQIFEGGQNDTSMIYVEFSDSLGYFIVNRFWYFKKPDKLDFKYLSRIKKKKAYCVFSVE